MTTEAKQEKITVAEFARRTNLSKSRVHELIQLGRIEGVERLGDHGAGSKKRAHLILIPWPTTVSVANESRQQSAAMKATTG
tara:strand:- start:532 stop:777 length:246 start_codon:yes stop_codon:yes gene_type:complete